MTPRPPSKWAPMRSIKSMLAQMEKPKPGKRTLTMKPPLPYYRLPRLNGRFPWGPWDRPGKRRGIGKRSVGHGYQNRTIRI